MEIANVLLIGGSGFVGSCIARQLSARGLRVVVPTRRRERAKHLILLPTVEVVEADVHDPASLQALCAGQDAVISLVGILQSRRGFPYGADFARAHVDLPKKIVAACRQNGVRRIVHLSALKAASDAPSMYLRSKVDGEAAIRAGAPDIATTILRPSVIFGQGDSFLSLFAELARRAPVLPLASPNARFQPVHVEDVARVVADVLGSEDSIGKAYELCGPMAYTLRQLVEYVGVLAGCRRPVIGLSPGLSYLQARLMELLPGELMSRDNVDSMRIDNVCNGCALPFGLLPTALESVAPSYIARRAPRSAYNSMREKARR
jgi:NADH dehydrogenase